LSLPAHAETSSFRRSATRWVVETVHLAERVEHALFVVELLARARFGHNVGEQDEAVAGGERDGSYAVVPRQRAERESEVDVEKVTRRLGHQHR